MTDSEKQRFAETLCAASDLYGRPLSVPAIELYWSLCRRLTLDDFHRALGACLERSRFLPSPAEILAASGAVRGPEDQHALAIREWDAVQRAVLDVGAYRSVQFTDPATAATVQSLGGWQGMCRPEEPEHFLRRRFVETWSSYDQVRHELPAPQVCAGLIEAQNGTQHARHTPPPVLIGSGPMRAAALPDPDEPAPRDIRTVLRLVEDAAAGEPR